MVISERSTAATSRPGTFLAAQPVVGWHLGAALLLRAGCQVLGHEKVDLYADFDLAYLLGALPQADLSIAVLVELEGEAGRVHRFFEERLLAQGVRIDADVTVGGIGGAADCRFGGAEVDGLGADDGERLTVTSRAMSASRSTLRAAWFSSSSSVPAGACDIVPPLDGARF